MAMQTFNDELDEIPTAQNPTAQQAATATPTGVSAKASVGTATATATAKPKAVEEDTPKAAATAEVDNESLDTDFDDKRVYDRPGQLNQVRPEKGKAVRFAFVPKEWIAPQTAKAHFVETGTGKDIKKLRVRCLTPMSDASSQAYCCQAREEDGEIGVVALVVHYTNANATDGKYEKNASGEYPGVEFEIGFVRLSGFNMRQIKKLPDEDSSPFSIDIVMTHADGRAFGYEFNRKSNVPRWTLDPEVAARVKNACQRFLDGKALRGKLGQKMNEIEWKALLSGQKVGNESKLANVDEL